MNIEDIHKLWEEDSKIDRSDLHIESLNIPKLHSKYMKLYSRERELLLKLEAQYKMLRFEKREFYIEGPTKEQLEKGWKFPGRPILKTEVESFLEGDKELVKLGLQISFQKEKLDLIDSIVRNINNRGFQIKNAIDWVKFINGQN